MFVNDGLYSSESISEGYPDTQRKPMEILGGMISTFHASSFARALPSKSPFALGSCQVQQLLPPPCWIFHVPHDSTTILAEVRDQFIMADDLLRQEILRMTEHHTFDLFAAQVPEHQVVRFPVSRLVVDVERFEQDDEEPMSARGMGVIYQVTHELRPLRRSLTPSEREGLMSRWYRPHHQALSATVDDALENFGRALVIDAHSFPSKPLPYETDAMALRPEICIGADPYHTPQEVVELLLQEFESCGFVTAVNTPFAGALVPTKHYRRDPRVNAVMIEVRRDLYLNENTGQLDTRSSEIAQKLRSVLINSLT